MLWIFIYLFCYNAIEHWKKRTKKIRFKTRAWHDTDYFHSNATLSIFEFLKIKIIINYIAYVKMSLLGAISFSQLLTWIKKCWWSPSMSDYLLISSHSSTKRSLHSQFIHSREKPFSPRIQIQQTALLQWAQSTIKLRLRVRRRLSVNKSQSFSDALCSHRDGAERTECRTFWPRFKGFPIDR